MKIKKILRKKVFIPAIFVITLLLIATNTTVKVSAAYPQRRVSHCMVYDSANDRIIMYGGQSDATYVSWKTDTWVYDLNNNTWTIMSPESVPYQKTGSRMVYDSESEKLINFGGTHAEDYCSDQTWIYDYLEDSWTNANPANTPRLRSSHAMAYDSESDIVIMFGGGLPSTFNPDGVFLQYNDTLAYDFNTNTWTNKTPAITPLGRTASKMTYDSESDRIIIFGGFHYAGYPFSDPTGEIYQKETWAYDYNTNTWENITPSISPEPRIGFSMTYDEESDRVILFGGNTHLDLSGLQDETWSFDYNSLNWTQMNPDTELVRIDSKMVYDIESDKIVLFGGIIASSPNTFLAETWVYDYNTDTWTLMEVPEPDDSNLFFIPTLISVSMLAIVITRRRKNR